MTSLITGGRGFAGVHLAHYLREQGDEVIQLDLAQCDLRDAAQCERVLREIRPARIYHLAAISSSVEAMRDPMETYAVNFGGTLNLLDAWRRIQFDCRFLLVSSSEVYGPRVSEDAPLAPRTPYSASKAAAEMLAMQCGASWGLPIIRVRPFTHTGPGQTDRFVCSSFARQAASGASRISVGNIALRRDFSDVRDIVRGYHLLLERGTPGEVYNLCSGRAVSLESILRHLTPTAEVVVDPSRLRGSELSEICGDYGKAKADVGWTPSIPLETTLDDLLSWWRVISR